MIKKYRKDPESIWIIFLLALLVSFTSVSVDLLTPSLPILTEAFNTTSTGIKMLINAFFFGFAIAHLFWGVFSDKYGRRTILLIGISIYCAASLACLASDDLSVLLVSRFLQGVGGASCVILCRAVVRDIYGAEGATRAMATVIMVFAPVPVFMPIIGGFLITHFEWTSLFLAMVICGLITILLVVVLLGETAPAKTIPEQNFSDGDRGFLPVIRNTFFMRNTLSNMFCFGSLLICITNFPYFLYNTYQFSPQQVGWFFALFDAALFLGVLILRVIVPRIGITRTLYSSFYLIAFGWTALVLIQILNADLVIYSAMAIAASCTGMGIVMSLTPGQAMVPFTINSGAASSLYGILQYGGATLLVSLVNSYYGESILMTIIFATIASYLSLILYWGFGLSGSSTT